MAGGDELICSPFTPRDAGVASALSVEIVFTEHSMLLVGEAARRAYASARRVIDRAWP